MKKNLTWTIRFETATGTIYTSKYAAPTMSDAITILVSDRSVANILAVHQGRVRWM